MQWLKKITRPEILKLIPYSSARNECAQNINNIQLDANENPWQPYTHSYHNDTLNRYPDPQPSALKHKLAALYGADEEQLLITRGADEGIELLIRTFCVPQKDNILVTPPTYSAYSIFAETNGNQTLSSPLDPQNNFMPNMADLLKKHTAHTRLIFLCSPNNPTATLIPLSFISELCNKVKEKSIVVIDEAYLEFSDDAPSAITLLGKHENLAILRTLSKAYALAGARIGSVIAHPEMIQLLRKVQQPYPISTSSAKIALEALSPIGLAYARRHIQQILSERDRLEKVLSNLPDIEKIYPSQTNFLLIQVKDANTLYQRLKNQGIIIRNRSQVLSDSLRITIGTSEENDILIQSLTGETKKDTSHKRTATQIRKTNETEIMVYLSLDDPKPSVNIHTAMGFFDHMLEQLAKHSGITLEINAIGDTHIDAHHTVEDVAIVLGQALKQALGNKKGIGRYGFVLPMDEACAQTAIDLSGRGALVFDANFSTPMVGDFPIEMLKHFYWTLAMNMEAAIHIHITGENAHHMVESSFKSFAKSLKQAVSLTGDDIPSTKGVLS